MALAACRLAPVILVPRWWWLFSTPQPDHEGGVFSEPTGQTRRPATGSFRRLIQAEPAKVWIPLAATSGSVRINLIAFGGSVRRAWRRGFSTGRSMKVLGPPGHDDHVGWQGDA